MDANDNKSIKLRLKKIMDQYKVNVLQLSRETGIPAGRIYKWFQQNTQPKYEDAVILDKWMSDLDKDTNEAEPYHATRRNKKLSTIVRKDVISKSEGVPVYDVPIDASFIERYNDENYEPVFFLNIPKLRNCNFGAVVSGSSMYPIMKSGSIALCRIVENLDYFDPGEMYFLSTTNGFETVKYVQPGETQDELLLIPHNEKIKPTTIKKNMVIRMCIVEAWINFR